MPVIVPSIQRGMMLLPVIVTRVLGVKPGTAID